MPPQQLDKGGGSPTAPPSDRRRDFITHLSMDEGSARRLLDASETDDNNPSMKEFLLHFVNTSGPPQIIALCLLLALALGSTVGVVPAIVEDRYARLHHGHDGAPCLDIPQDERPVACLRGNEDAQNAAAFASALSNILTFTTSSLMGSISDERGRRGIMLLGMGLGLMAPLNLVILQMFEDVDPFYYYASHAISGIVSWMAVALSAISDVMPPMWRAPSFGMVIAGFSMGFALSPILAVFLSHLGVSIFALSVLVGGFTFACLFMPETLSPEASERARAKRLVERPRMDSQMDVIKYNLLRPARELLILNRNKLFRLLSTLAFFSGIVSTADHTLFIYYVEENLGFDDKDIAKIFLIIGVMGMFVQTVVLKPLNSRIGERRVIMVAFFVGAIHNYLYGVAKDKRTIFLSATIASLTGMSFPTISAIKANNVEESEQGRIQGALYSLSALASALGPLSLRYVYHKTKDSTGGFGKGTMFIFGAGLYLIAVVCAWLLPEEQANSNFKSDEKKRSSLVDFDRGKVDYGALIQEEA